MKFILILTLTLYANHIKAVVIWPGSSAPCNTTLTACAEGISAGEVIEIRTNGPINESFTTGRGLSIIAGAGFKPVFASGNVIDISATAPGSTEVTISGLTLIRGRISFIARGAPGQSYQINIHGCALFSCSTSPILKI